MNTRLNEVFDHKSATYSEEVNEVISFIGQDLDFFTKAKADRLIEVTGRLVGNPKRLKALDVGCGVGLTEKYLNGRFAELHGVDISANSVKTAQEKNPGVLYSFYSGPALPYPDNSFDVTFAICVMHHVPRENWADFLSEMKRVTVPGGLCIIFEHNPLNPITRAVVSRCDMDKDAVLLWPKRLKESFQKNSMPIAEKSYILFFPFASSIAVWVEKRLQWLPLGAQYYMGALKPVTSK